MKRIVDFISYKIIPIITLDRYAPNVAPWNISFLNWYYLKRSMKRASKNSIRGICVDIGAGNSPYKRYLSVDKYISIDQEDTRAVSYQKNIHSINADAKELPFNPNEIDTVLLNQVLEHVFEYEKVLSEIHRVLKEDGKLIISIPFIFHVHSEPNDYFRFSEYGIKKLLLSKGFKIVDFEYNGYFGTTIVSLTNSFLWQIWNKNLFLKFLRNTFLLVPLFSIFFINNCLGLLLDLLKEKKFSPNYFITCERINE